MLDDFFKELVIHNLVKASLSRLFLAVPILGWGPFGLIISYFAYKYADLFYEEMKLVIAIEKIKITNSSFEEAYNKESLRLRIYCEEYGIDSPEYKDIKNKAKKALADLVQFTIVS